MEQQLTSVRNVRQDKWERGHVSPEEVLGQFRAFAVSGEHADLIERIEEELAWVFISSDSSRRAQLRPFLLAYSRTGKLRASAAKGKIPRSTASEWGNRFLGFVAGTLREEARIAEGHAQRHQEKLRRMAKQARDWESALLQCWEQCGKKYGREKGGGQNIEASGPYTWKQADPSGCAACPKNLLRG